MDYHFIKCPACKRRSRINMEELESRPECKTGENSFVAMLLCKWCKAQIMIKWRIQEGGTK